MSYNVGDWLTQMQKKDKYHRKNSQKLMCYISFWCFRMYLHRNEGMLQEINELFQDIISKSFSPTWKRPRESGKKVVLVIKPTAFTQPGRFVPLFRSNKKEVLR